MSEYTIMSENGRDHIVHEASKRWITTLIGGDGILFGSKVVKILNEETAPLIAEIAGLKRELEAEKAKMKQINMIAWDALHSLHYGEIPRNTLEEEFAKIRGYSDTESEADNEPTP